MSLTVHKDVELVSGESTKSFINPNNSRLGANGKHCMLKTLCIVGKTNDHPQGAFLQEILRAVFT